MLLFCAARLICGSCYLLKPIPKGVIFSVIFPSSPLIVQQIGFISTFAQLLFRIGPSRMLDTVHLFPITHICFIVLFQGN